jgi:hypothetical protein
MNKSLSNFELEKALNNKIKIIVYSEIEKYKNINDLLNPYNQIIILYNISDSYGHWTCLFKVNNEIKFFDSYGLIIDEQRKYIPELYKKEHYPSINYLCKLLHDEVINNPFLTVSYNPYKLQKQDHFIQTCGRWCYYRLINKNLSHKQFYNKFKNINNKDLAITLLTRQFNI